MMPWRFIYTWSFHIQRKNEWFKITSCISCLILPKKESRYLLCKYYEHSTFYISIDAMFTSIYKVVYEK